MAEVRHDRRTLRRARTLQEEVADAWNEVLTTLDWVDVELSEVREWAPTMMGYGLNSFDAVHAATAVYADVRPFVTLDYHFSLVSEVELELYVPANRVKPCRDRRR